MTVADIQIEVRSPFQKMILDTLLFIFQKQIMTRWPLGSSKRFCSGTQALPSD